MLPTMEEQKPKPKGRPKKPPGAPPDEHRDKTTYNPTALADSIIPKIMSGHPLRPHHSLGHITDHDRRTLTRITGESVEVFNERIATKLRDIADIAADRIREKLESDQFKPGELGFILSVAHDKRLSLDGSRALNNASVNVQINNYGSSPKETLLADLDGLSPSKPPQPINV